MPDFRHSHGMDTNVRHIQGCIQNNSLMKRLFHWLGNKVAKVIHLSNVFSDWYMCLLPSWYSEMVSTFTPDNIVLICQILIFKINVHIFISHFQSWLCVCDNFQVLWITNIFGPQWMIRSSSSWLIFPRYRWRYALVMTTVSNFHFINIKKFLDRNSTILCYYHCTIAKQQYRIEIVILFKCNWNLHWIQYIHAHLAKHCLCVFLLNNHFGHTITQCIVLLLAMGITKEYNKYPRTTAHIFSM